MMSAPTQNNTSLLTASKISIRFQNRQILSDVDLQIDRGRIVTLIGPNGAGKTTLVRIILDLLKADSGEIWKTPGLTIGYMPQRLHIEPTMPMTVERFLMLSGVNDSKHIQALLEELGITHLTNQQMRNVSGGELQRVLLCRALIRKPDLLILDEPAQGVDVTGQSELYQLITRMAVLQGCGVLMISHDLHLVMSATDEVICLNHHICCHGKPEQVSSDPAYLSLFGASTARNIAVYTHDHNHSHDLDGNVVDQCEDDHG